MEKISNSILTVEISEHGAELQSIKKNGKEYLWQGEGIRTEAFDPSKMVDPSLIIYAPVRVLGNKTIVTNGDQTDTIYDLMDKQMTLQSSYRHFLCG